MKDIKSILIGVFATTCLFLFMGQKMSTTQVGRYEIEVLSEPTALSGSDWHDYSYFVFDTQIGKIIKHGTMTKIKTPLEDEILSVKSGDMIIDVPNEK
mgnify:CR=1 FL=1|tara:strand:+ start:577 stop:870 length:294 start_codon:yes stop_codon:yes gene_type:complete